jgi:hypothetical protein
MSIGEFHKKEVRSMPKYEARIQFTLPAGADAEAEAKAAKALAAKAAATIGGKVDKVMTEKLAFRSLED